MNKVLTYGLTKEEIKLLKNRHTEFEFKDVSDCFPNLLELNSIAIIMNPDALSKDEEEQLTSVYNFGYAPLFIFTKPGECVCDDEICDIMNDVETASRLDLAKNYYLCYEEFKDYFDAKVDEMNCISSTRADNAEVKRVELYCHTKMTDMNGIVSARDLVECAARWGHKAIAITDTHAVQAFPEAYRAAHGKNIKVILGTEIISYDNTGTYLPTFLVKNHTGLKNLYKLISLSHTNYCDGTRGGGGRLPIEVVMAHREGLLIGLPLFGKYVYDAIKRGDTAEKISEFAVFYDYIELYPQGEKSLNILVAQLGEILNKPVVAVSDVSYLAPKDRTAHRVLCARIYEKWENIASRHFRTTEEMLEEFAYLGEEKAYEVVVTNTNLIADMIEDIQPIPNGLFLPTLDGMDEYSLNAEMEQLCNARIKAIYGDDPPDDIMKRFKYELNCIANKGYSVIYMIAHKLVKQSNDDGYLVGSRGSVGASLVAYLLGITEFNPIDYNIPFEVFAGLNGDKMPDIDLNFAAEYQRKIHKYVKELFGKDRVFCAGRVYVTEENIAAEIVQKYFNNKNMIPYPPIFNCLVDDIQWMKRTTGQAPGSLMIVPSDKEIFDFTPIQYPGDKKSSGVLTTHFDSYYLTDTLLKLDLLGHDAPTRLKKLEDLTGVNAKDVSLDDEETLNLFINADTIGVPEFGTDSVRNMIKIANPKTFDDLVKISGLLHGTDVWKDNAENLINSGTATISEVIALRDEIMMYLIDKDIDRETAYVIMDRVRRGKGLTNEHAGIMRAAKVPDWYIDSCNKIQYMFPKAHTVGYTIMAFRIAWFKAHHLETFYKAVFEIHNDFDVDFMSLDISETKKLLKEMKVKRDSLPYDDDNYYVDYLYCEDMYNLLQVRLEMLEINSFCDL